MKDSYSEATNKDIGDAVDNFKLQASKQFEFFE